MHILHQNSQKNKRDMRKKDFCFAVLFMCMAVHGVGYGQKSNFEKEEIKKIDKTLELYEDKNKYKYLVLLPSLNYDPLQKSFTIGFSLNGLSNYIQQRKRNKIQLKQLEISLKENLKKETEKISFEIESFDIEKNSIKESLIIFDLDHKLFAINKGKYNNSEISTEDFLKLKQQYLKQKLLLKSRLYKLQLNAKKIESKIKSDTLTVSLKFLSNSINNYE